MRNTMRRNSPTSAVYGRTIDGVIHGLFGKEILTKYCPIMDELLPINYFYPVSGSRHTVRRVCRKAWDTRVTDPFTGRRVTAAGVKKYDWLVRKELGLSYHEPEERAYVCLESLL